MILKQKRGLAFLGPSTRVNQSTNYGNRVVAQLRSLNVAENCLAYLYSTTFFLNGLSNIQNVDSHADVLRGSSRVPAPLTSAEPKDKFDGDHMQIMGEPIGAVEVKVFTSQTHTYKLGRA